MIVDKLKQIVTTLGGTFTDADNTISKMLARVNAAFQSGAGAGLPAVSGSDNGMLLGVAEGAWTKVSAPTELPAVTGSDNGRLLGVSSGAWAAVPAPTELPAVTGDDNGKTLAVRSGAWTAIKTKTRVTFTLTVGNDGIEASADKTFAQLAEVLAAGCEVGAEVITPDDETYFLPFAYQAVSGQALSAIGFSAVFDSAEAGSTPQPTLYQIIYNSDGTIGVRNEALSVAEG